MIKLLVVLPILLLWMNNGNAKLSLIFNAFGISSETIACLHDVDGEQLLNMDPFNLCKEHGVNNQEDGMDLCFLKMMLEENKLPSKAHRDQSLVCSCGTPNELKYLLQERNMNYDLLVNHKINGPRFISNTQLLQILDIQNERNDRKNLLEAVNALKQDHNTEDE